MSDLTEFHDELRAVARELLAPTSPLVTGGEAATAEWGQLAAAGWLGLDVPEEHAGSGASFAEVAVILEEWGRAATAGPLLGTVLAVGALGLAEPSKERDELLAGVATGDVGVAVALPAGDEGVAGGAIGGQLPFRVECTGGTARLTGCAAFVADAPEADRVLVVADDPAAGPVLVDTIAGEDLVVRRTPVVDATRSLGEVTADGTTVDATRCWRLTGDPVALAHRAALAVALDAVGVAGAALDATVAYARERRQFGRPIGSFQAVKHACADVAVELTISRRLVADAVASVVAGAPGVDVAVSMAKAHAVETAVSATGRALQLHGGIGYTWEHGLHVLVKRAALDRSLFGSPAAHRALVARRYAVAAGR